MNWIAIIEFAVKNILGSAVFGKLMSIVWELAKQEPDIGESQTAFNDRRRREAIDEIQALWPETRTALLDIAIGVLVNRMHK